MTWLYKEDSEAIVNFRCAFDLEDEVSSIFMNKIYSKSNSFHLVKSSRLD